MIVQISDPHIGWTTPGARPEERLRAAVEAIGALERTPDAVVVTGDIANDGTDEQYATAQALLAPLRAPVHVLPGNHDDRARMRAAFDLPGEGDAPIRYVADTPDLRLVACDTQIPGRGEGAVDDDAVGWLERTLAESNRPTIVALHHPPIATGVRAFDDFGIDAAQRAALAATLDRHPHVQRVIAGHLHRAITGTTGRTPVFVCPSTDLQLALDLSGNPDFVVTREPPAFAVHLLVEGVLVSHLQPTA